MGRYSKLRRNLLDLSALNHALGVDTQLSLSGLGRASRDYENADEKDMEILFEYCFWNRIAVRAFFAHMEGLSYFMRRTAARPRNAAVLNLTKKKIAELLELRYDRAQDQIAKITMPNKVGDNVKLAFRYYPKIFGVDFTLDTNSPTWKALIKILVLARNSMTHAGTFEDFYAVEAVQTLKPCLVWFLGSMVQMVSTCCQQVGVSTQDIDATLMKDHEFMESDFIQFTLPREEFFREVAKFQGRSFRLFEWSMSLLWKETNKAFGYFNSQDKIFALEGVSTQFAIRNCFRTLITYAEGATYAMRVYIEHAEKRGEISLTEKERTSLTYKYVFDRLVATIDIFAKSFGSGGTFEVADEHWDAVRTVLGYRDSLTHPGAARDLEFKEPRIRTTIANCIGWLVDVLDNFKLDAEKIIEQGISSGSIIPSANE